MSENDELSDNKTVKNCDEGSKELKKVASNNDHEPKVKEFHFIKEAQFFPVFVPVDMSFHCGLLYFTLICLHLLFVGHVVSRNGINLFPRQSQT